MTKRFILPLAAGILLFSCALPKKTSKQIDAIASTVKADTTRKDSTKKLKPYNEVITSKAITQNGLFKVHQVNERYYFEIADSLLNRDILVVNRISKGNISSRGSGYGGDYIAESVIQFARSSINKLFIYKMSYILRADDSTENGLYKSVENSNLQPIMAAFDIKALSADSNAVVIDVTDLLNSDNELFGFTNYAKRRLGYGLGGFQNDKSYINYIHSYPSNIEIRTIKTYTRGANGPFTIDNATFELNNSIVLLPKHKMTERYEDSRVGYFTRFYMNYDASEPVTWKRMIVRWRMEPRDEEISKYLKGNLVEPKKPIIFYIDPATPKKWVPYLIQGVNDWQKAFEKAGFKNAIYALEAPQNDSTWSVDDATHNVIVYKASDNQNASGPSISDPRSGEIIESHIDWYHNIQELMHNWYMVQAGPNDSKAQTMNFDDSLMGRLIRYVCSHEVGHTLGLEHNFYASSTVPVDSLRSKSYVDKNGYCPSIMDYARFNYVAQPEDKFSRDELIPRIGIYDQWAIEWGYKWLPPFKTPEDEKAFMNHWISEKLKNDERLRFGGQSALNDPHRQSEDIGDNAIKAGYYGIQNLKRIVPNLKEWTRVSNDDYQALKEIYKEVYDQFQRYIQHVVVNIGGCSWVEKKEGESGVGMSFPSSYVQKQAVEFLNREVFTTPRWLINNEIIQLTAGDGFTAASSDFFLVMSLQNGVIAQAVSFGIYANLLMAQTLHPVNCYKVDEYLTDLESGIWHELKTGEPIDLYRRNLQKIYAQRLIDQLDPLKLNVYDAGFPAIYSDFYPIIKKHLTTIAINIKKIERTIRDSDTKMHLIEIKDRIVKALQEAKAPKPSSQNLIQAPKAFNKREELDLQPSELYFMQTNNCWNDSFKWQ